MIRAPAAAKARAPPMWSPWTCVRISARTGLFPVVCAIRSRISFPLLESPPETTATTPSPSRNHPTFAPLDGIAAQTPSASCSAAGFFPAALCCARAGERPMAVTRRTRIPRRFCIATILTLRLYRSGSASTTPQPARNSLSASAAAASPTLRAARRLDELREEARRRGIAGEILRVPLDGHEPALRGAGGLHRLGDPVLGRRRDREARSDARDRLVVPAVHRDLGRAGDRLEARAGRDGDRVVELRLLRRGVGGLVHDGGRPLEGQILHERPAEGHVDDLQAAADSEHGALAPQGLLEQREVDRVALRVDLHVPVREERVAVARRIDV